MSTTDIQTNQVNPFFAKNRKNGFNQKRKNLNAEKLHNLKEGFLKTKQKPVIDLFTV